MPRLVRRKSPLERLKDKLILGDWLLWLSEEIETRDWDSTSFATPLALGLHVIFLIARANSSPAGSSERDEIFGEEYNGIGWLSYIATFTVSTLTLLSAANSWYTFARRRHYRLFESPIEQSQNTPSAHRVRVDSPPMSSSPSRLLSNVLREANAESRAHPDAHRDVWEIAVWDPIPSCLRLFCLFSPGHVLVYWLFLPTLLTDPRPSVTIFTTIVLELLLSSQLLFLQMSFSQQVKDSILIHKEVMNEYDIKYVHPRLNPLMRDVGTQYTDEGTDITANISNEVVTYIPSVILKKGFRTNPNPNYAKHIDPENYSNIVPRNASPELSFIPQTHSSRESTPFNAATPRPSIRQPQFRQSISSAVAPRTNRGDGGSLGIYSNVNSPLKKAVSMNDMQTNGRQEAPRNSYEMAGRERHEHRDRGTSTSKKQQFGTRPLPGDENPHDAGERYFGVVRNKSRTGNYDSPYKKELSRF